MLGMSVFFFFFSSSFLFFILSPSLSPFSRVVGVADFPGVRFGFPPTSHAQLFLLFSLPFHGFLDLCYFLCSLPVLVTVR